MQKYTMHNGVIMLPVHGTVHHMSKISTLPCHWIYGVHGSKVAVVMLHKDGTLEYDLFGQRPDDHDLPMIQPPVCEFPTLESFYEGIEKVDAHLLKKHPTLRNTLWMPPDRMTFDFYSGTGPVLPVITSIWAYVKIIDLPCPPKREESYVVGLTI